MTRAERETEIADIIGLLEEAHSRAHDLSMEMRDQGLAGIVDRIGAIIEDDAWEAEE